MNQPPSCQAFWACAMSSGDTWNIATTLSNAGDEQKVDPGRGPILFGLAQNVQEKNETPQGK